MPAGFEVEDNSQYEGAGQTAQAGLEGAVGSILGPGVDLPGAPGLKTGLGVASYEGMRGRAAAHPIAHVAGEVAGLVAGPEGEGLEAVGKGAAGLAGLAIPTSRAAKIGSSIVRNAAEMAAYQSQDEIGKMILKDPDAGAESAISNVGLAAALGGAAGGVLTGVVSPLWSATVGSKLGDSLKAITSHLGGVEGDEAATMASELESKTGVPIAPQYKAVIDDLPGQRANHSILSQSDTSMAGRSYQKGLNELNDNLANKVVESLGRDPGSVESLPELDKYTVGRSIGDTLKSEIEPISNEISSRYDKITDEFKKSPLSNEDKRLISDEISQKSMENGWHKAESDAQRNLSDNVLKKINFQENLDDLKKFMSNLRDSHPFGSETYQAAKDIQNVLKNNQERIISENIGRSGEPGVKLNEYRQLKSDYSKLMDSFDNLNEHLHVGRYDGPKSFLKALGEMSTANGEAVLNRLSGVNKADVLEQLKQFPQTLDKVKQYHVDKLLSDAVKKAGPDARINVNSLIKKTGELTPQLKALVASPEQHKTIQAVAQTLEALKDPNHNFSNTARTMSKLLHSTPSALSFLAAMMGHAEAGALSYLGKLGFTEGKDALKLGMMKFLGSSKPVSPEGFKAATTFLNTAQKGANILSKATENVFKPGAQVLVSSQIPTSAELMKLDKLVASNDPKDTNKIMASQETPVGHYLPDHQTAMSKSSLQALQYLKTLKPQDIQNNPLDTPMKPTAEQEARYKRALSIAQQPAIVLEHVKNGTIKANDVKDLNGMYPALYRQLSQKMTNDMINHKSEENPIPYRTRMGISLFLGQPMDQSMQPASIQAAQPIPKPQQPQQGKTKKGTSTLGKSNKNYQTSTQSAESDRNDR